MPMITLAPCVRLSGGTLRFGAKGVQLTLDNVLDSVTIKTVDEEVVRHAATSDAVHLRSHERTHRPASRQRH
jgi:hypothetical protein